MAEETNENVQPSQKQPWTQRHRKLLIAVPYIMILVLIVGVYLGLRLGAVRSMKEYLSFDTTYDRSIVVYSDDEEGPLRSITVFKERTINTNLGEVPVIAQKTIYTFKNKKTAEQYAEDIANGSTRVRLLNEYVVVEPLKYESVGSDKYKETYNVLVDSLTDNEKMYRILVAFGGKVIE